MRKKIITFLPLIMLIVLALVFLSPLLKHKDPHFVESAMIGRTAPPISLSSLGTDQKEFSAALFGTNAVLVNFFASWCVSCAAEQETLVQIKQEYKIPIYGIAYKDKIDPLKKWLHTYGNPFAAIGLDADGRSAIDWGVSGVPETFIVDKSGIIRYRHSGPLTMESYLREIKPVLEDMQK